jgi:hypothetical protein
VQDEVPDTDQWPGMGNIDEDPLFEAPPLNLRLQAGSPCRDSGDDSHPGPDSLDIDHDNTFSERIPDLDLKFRQICGVDMGAFERGGSCPADCADCDGDVDVTDLLALLAQWDSDGSCNIAVLPGESPPSNVDVTDLVAFLAAWDDCASPGGGHVPQTVEECLEKYETTAEEIACIEALCRSGQVPPEECPD